MSDVEQTHEEKETLKVDVELPGHAPRVETPLFSKTREERLKIDNRCWICGKTAEEAGSPLQLHHFPIERSLAEGVDFHRVQADCEAGMWGEPAKNFDWNTFWSKGDVYLFVDDMTVNGLPLCEPHHIGADAGIHMLPHPLWVVQRYLQDGYQYTDKEKICHEEVSQLK